MNVVNYFINLLAFISASMACLLIILLYLRQKKSQVLYVLLFFTPFAIGSFLWLLSNSELFSNNTISQLHMINGTIAFFIAPFSCFKLLGFKFTKSKQIFLLIMLIVAIATIIANIISKSEMAKLVTMILRLFGLIFVYWLLFRNRKKIVIKEMKAFYSSFLIASGCLVAILFLLVILRLLKMDLAFKIESLPLDQIFTGLLGSLIFIFLARFFFIKNSTIEYSDEKNRLRDFSLTSREEDIVQLILNGYTSKEASKLLKISQQTVKNHTANIYKKLNINSKIELFQLINGF